MRMVSAFSVMGLMASLMSRSDMAGILQGNSHTGKVERESESHIIPPPCNQTATGPLLLAFGNRGCYFTDRAHK
jgi:hypothetical protein